MTLTLYWALAFPQPHLYRLNNSTGYDGYLSCIICILLYFPTHKREGVSTCQGASVTLLQSTRFVTEEFGESMPLCALSTSNDSWSGLCTRVDCDVFVCSPIARPLYS